MKSENFLMPLDLLRKFLFSEMNLAKSKVRNPNLWFLAYFIILALKPSAYKHYFNLLQHS